MAISSTNRVAGPFLGDGITSTFPFTFKVFAAADLFVATLVAASGAVTTLLLTTDYSVTLNADQDSTPGGSITLAVPLATGTTLMITTAMAALQGLDLTNGGGFYPDVINSSLDTLTILVQQILNQLKLALQVPMAESGSAVTALPSAPLRAGKLLMFDAAGNPSLVTVASGSIVPGAQSAAGTIDGGNKNFTFTAAAGTTPSILVFVAGIFQDPANDYAVTFTTGTTWQIAFTNAPTEGPVKVLMLS